MYGIFQVNILLGTNLDFAVIQKQSRLQFTPYWDIRRPVCIWSIILSKATFWIDLESCATMKNNYLCSTFVHETIMHVLCFCTLFKL